jgi:diaminohydroxyphosphoribosylaminopyrimidine deaminase/5-amino-6-(5-phosphoribosylamino)uracil reductase
VESLPQGPLQDRCESLIAPFVYRALTGLPWVTVKQAVRRTSDGETMIPLPGQKTFTSEASLRLAHELRKRADAILTGSGTILADRPEFTVRRTPDHPGKVRWLSILDRRGRVESQLPEWVAAARGCGFEVHFGRDLMSELKWLSDQGVMEVLVEAGPALTQAVMQSDFWCRHVLIRSSAESGQADEIRDEIRNSSRDMLNPGISS